MPRVARAVLSSLLLIAVSSLAVIAILYGVGWVQDRFGGEEGETALGATFSLPYAEELGLDWREAYLAVLDELGVRRLRIAAYWNDIEPQPGVFRFDEVDWQIAEAAKRRASIILAIGVKLPRWPECRTPEWARSLPPAEFEDRVLAMVDRVVERYKDEPAIVAWQVENETFYPFGTCPDRGIAALEAEIALVRSLDDRPVMLQDIGELSTWRKSARRADRLGVSMYRVVWDPRFGFVRWPGVAAAFRLRAALAERHVDEVLLTEMQAEPWTTKPVAEVPIADQLRQMNPRALRSNVRFARRIGFRETYVWGVEWWYWLKQRGHPEMWEAGKELMRYEEGG